VSELTLLLLRVAFLAALWVFVFFVVYSIRADLFGQRVRRLPEPSDASKGDGASNDVVTPVSAGNGSTGVLAEASRDLELVLTTGTTSGKSIALSGEPVTSGRSPDSTIVIGDDYTSTHHARMAVVDGKWVLTDLGSTNGTLCDGSRVSGSVPLHIGELITVGQTTLQVRERV